MIRRRASSLAGASLLLLSVGLLWQPRAFAAGRQSNAAGCVDGQNGCMRAMLKLLDHDRAVRGVAPLQLTMVQSVGRASCVGSFGHSTAMARTGDIWHTNPKAPRASFPNNICVAYSMAGENVGQSASGDELQDLTALDKLMMSEPHTRSVCASTDNHACNILNPAFRHVGIGIYHTGTGTWLTEDFTN